MLYCDQYHVPQTLEEAFDLIQTNKGSYKVLAGATDLLPWAREGRGGDVNFESVIDISKITDMNEWQLQGDRISLGANVTMQQLLEDPFLRKHIPVMAKSAVWFADDQIREQATLGGNLVNASPAADATPPMLAMNAELTLQRKYKGKINQRKLPLHEFVTGPGKTRLEEFMQEVKIEDYKVEKTFLGIEMEGKKYIHPLLDKIPELEKLSRKDNYHVVVSEEFVDVNTGSGLVHLSPANGEEDYNIATKRNVDVFSPIDDEVKFTDDAGEYSGK